ncbi:MAG TPA: NAD(P)-dependent oxidoreductase [Candidatus Micrarchaeia archaeon]|nr:NAD(P)-dependent oxidoreductase [Candidatus Micrarchaeia archaeon]
MPIFELVVACLLAHAKRLPDLAGQHRDRRWWAPDLRELRDVRGVILGLGTLGSAVALRLAPFGPDEVGVRRDAGRGVPAGVDRVNGPDGLAAACDGADALVVAAPDRGHAGAGGWGGAAGAGARVGGGQRRSGAAGRPAGAAGGPRPRTPRRSPPRRARRGAAAGDVGAVVHPGRPRHPHTSWSSPRFGERSARLFCDQVRSRLRGRPLCNIAEVSAGS